MRTHFLDWGESSKRMVSNIVDTVNTAMNPRIVIKSRKIFCNWQKKVVWCLRQHQPVSGVFQLYQTLWHWCALMCNLPFWGIWKKIFWNCFLLASVFLVLWQTIKIQLQWKTKPSEFLKNSFSFCWDIAIYNLLL